MVGPTEMATVDTTRYGSPGNGAEEGDSERVIVSRGVGRKGSDELLMRIAWHCLVVGGSCCTYEVLHVLKVLCISQGEQIGEAVGRRLDWGWIGGGKQG